MQEQYFFIDLENLPSDDSIFGFNLFIYEPHAKAYKLELPANSPFDSDARDKYKMLVSKGARLAINYKQKKTFLAQLGLKEEDIKELKSISHSVEEKRRLASEEAKAKSQFAFGAEFKEAIKTDNFEKILEQAKLEILCLPANFDQNLSNALYLTEMMLDKDCLSSRVVAVCYFMAKSMKMDKLEDIGDLLLAAYLYDIGITQLSLNYQTSAQIKLNERAMEDYRNHPGLAMHLIRKSKINMSLRCKKIIQDHHERHNGSGFPHGKKDIHVDKIGQILSLVDFAFQYSEGHITGTKTPLDEVVSNIKNLVAFKGMEFDFNPDMVTALYALCFRSGAAKAA